MSSAICNETNIARDELFHLLGEVDSDVISYMLNPSFMDGPKWPALRQTLSIIRIKDCVSMVSNGLSNPFDDSDSPNNGFKLEIIAETKEDIRGDVSSS